MALRSRLIAPVNSALRPMHVQLVRGISPDPAIKEYLPARRTLAAAERAGMPLGDYLDRTYARPNVSAETVDSIMEWAQLPASGSRVCEIGPGSGRYAEHVLSRLQPSWYEVYETASDWRAVLRQSMPELVFRDADGHTLGQTPDSSIDLVHAHKVFVYMEFFAIAGYLVEMARVVRPGGAVAFDIVTEDCLSDGIIDGWIRNGTIFRPVPRAWLVDFMRQRGLDLAGCRQLPLPDSVTELMVFTRSV